jgi:mono/diheme cytochrome c family protein
MIFRSNAARMLVAACAVLVPVLVAAQDAAPRQRAGRPETEPQKRGEALFFQNCTLCHTAADNRGQKGLGILAPTELIGFYKRPGLNDATVRQFIIAGSPGKMPGFRHTLSAEDLDDLVAYLKIR